MQFNILLEWVYITNLELYCYFIYLFNKSWLGNEYVTITSYKDQNEFSRAFNDLAGIDDAEEDLQAAVQICDDLKNDTANKLKILLD